MVEVPKYTDFSDRSEWNKPNSPAWFCPTQDGKTLKPVIRCNCGQWSGIGLHHVHADGTVTASFYHKKGTNYAIGEDPNGCEWHVWLKLLDYDGGDFPPRE